MKSLKKKESRILTLLGSCWGVVGTVLLIFVLAGVNVALLVENQRQTRLIGEVTADLSASRMTLTRANIRMDQMARTVRQLRAGEID